MRKPTKVYPHTFFDHVSTYYADKWFQRKSVKRLLPYAVIGAIIDRANAR